MRLLTDLDIAIDLRLKINPKKTVKGKYDFALLRRICYTCRTFGAFVRFANVMCSNAYCVFAEYSRIRQNGYIFWVRANSRIL